MASGIHAVTGAFGYSGRYIAARLLAQGREVITLTNSLGRANPFGGKVRAFPFNFDDPAALGKSLAGVAVLYNTYWVRFNRPMFTIAQAVRNTETLFRAAKEAGVERIVHVSITNPSEDSPLEYFRAKAQLERALRETGLSHAILRPAVLFGNEDILVNNIAWTLRRVSLFGMFGNGRYKLQPIHVEDLADLAVAQGDAREDATIDAIGPETFAYRELVARIAEIIGVRRPIVPLPAPLAYLGTWVVGRLVGDVIITWDEVKGLMGNKLCVDAPPAGSTKLTDWAREHAATLGLRYASELVRRRDREAAYGAR
ncbi:MAG TPA: epimerase [Planctomycetes bacterium]|nr:epimerase [Planctomycetota bacterium]